jgi:hypothetical protein
MAPFSQTHPFFTIGFWLSGSPSNRITMEFRLSRSLSHKLFLFTMESWLSRSLTHELLLFHDGILAIEEPFTRTFSFSRWNLGYRGAFHTNFLFFTMESWLSRSLSHELFLFHDVILAIKEPFTRTFFFHDGILRMHVLEEDSFHIYITKSIYIGSATLKTMPLDLEPPLQGKQYGPSYCKAATKKKTSVFFPEITYRHVIRLICFPKM